LGKLAARELEKSSMIMTPPDLRQALFFVWRLPGHGGDHGMHKKSGAPRRESMLADLQCTNYLASIIGELF
jgi:hypothetical protein